MGIHDRPYMHPGYRPSGGVMFGMLKPGKAVGWILIANIAAFADACKECVY